MSCLRGRQQVRGGAGKQPAGTSAVPKHTCCGGSSFLILCDQVLIEAAVPLPLTLDVHLVSAGAGLFGIGLTVPGSIGGGGGGYRRGGSGRGLPRALPRP